MTHEDYMREALREAALAAEAGEVPVGAVVAGPDGTIIGRGHNCREQRKDPAAHAELLAMAEAGRTLGDWRLSGCRLYVTLEPCPMCAGAILLARLAALYYGAREPVSGSCGSVLNLFMEPYGYSPAITGGVLEQKCAGLLRDFFRSRRDETAPDRLTGPFSAENEA